MEIRGISTSRQRGRRRLGSLGTGRLGRSEGWWAPGPWRGEVTGHPHLRSGCLGPMAWRPRERLRYEIKKEKNELFVHCCKFQSRKLTLQNWEYGKGEQ